MMTSLHRLLGWKIVLCGPDFEEEPRGSIVTYINLVDMYEQVLLTNQISISTLTPTHENLAIVDR